jgi:tryptophan synthase alpha chain
VSAVINNRIDKRFAGLREQGRTALIPFLTAGDPSPEATLAAMHAAVSAGADLIELGVPFSDPMADGPVIQKASERAIARGVDAEAVFDIVRCFRTTDAETPVVLMGYLNPVEILGRERYVREAAAAGVDGLLLVDAPLEEAAPFQRLLAEHGLHQILLAAPTTTGERRRQLAAIASGFIYYVAFAGVTGAAKLDAGSLATPVSELRALSRVPVVIGFGVRDADSARTVGALADGVVVGSALVERLAVADTHDAAGSTAGEFLVGLRRALDGLND